MNKIEKKKKEEKSDGPSTHGLENLDLPQVKHKHQQQLRTNVLILLCESDFPKEAYYKSYSI